MGCELGWQLPPFLFRNWCVKLESMEKWRWVVGYEGLYEISSCGGLRSVMRKDSLGRVRKSVVKATSVNPNGYVQSILYRENKGKNVYIHRLIAVAFLENTSNYPEINHRDGVKINNVMSNLEWCTPSYNKRHAISLGLRGPINHKGEAHPQCKLSEKEVRGIWKRYLDGDNTVAIANEYKITEAMVRAIGVCRVWPHLGLSPIYRGTRRAHTSTGKEAVQ